MELETHEVEQIENLLKGEHVSIDDRKDLLRKITGKTVLPSSTQNARRVALSVAKRLMDESDIDDVPLSSVIAWLSARYVFMDDDPDWAEILKEELDKAKISLHDPCTRKFTRMKLVDTLEDYQQGAITPYKALRSVDRHRDDLRVSCFEDMVRLTHTDTGLSLTFAGTSAVESAIKHAIDTL